MMHELSVENSATWVASHYHDFLSGFVIDQRDAELQSEIEATGLAVMVTQTVMETLDDRVTLARRCLQFLEQLA